MKNNILINASNLHVGGGVQVAVSFIKELVSLGEVDKKISIWVSSEVDLNLFEMGFNFRGASFYRVIDTYGLSLLFSPVRHEINSYNIVFTIYGPLYILNRKFISITGFAQAWIIYKNNIVYNGLNGIKKFRLKFEFFIKSLFFKLDKYYVVELDHVKSGLIKSNIAKDNSIFVVRNCISSLYFNTDGRSSFDKKIVFDGIKLGFVGRNYSHKNTKIFPEIAKELHSKYKFNVKFYVTFNEFEWESCSDEFKACSVNVGELSVAQCPGFYEAMDGVIFPSLLECFSATPLEAMAMGKPLFATDVHFNRDICGDHANYFDPNDLIGAADLIFNYYTKDDSKCKKLNQAKMHAINFSNPVSRAVKYMDLISGIDNGL